MISEIIFSKKFDEIGLEDLKAFFSEPQEETSVLEFKTGQVSIEQILPEICAFLNTEGGVLIVGTPKEQRREPSKHSQMTYCQGDLIPSKFRNKDWLMQKIVSNISPMPVGIKIQELLHENGGHFIIEVPQSISPPHQSGDGAYYIRLEREAKAAPHGVVEALFFKRQKPDLSLEADFWIDEKMPNYVNLSFNISNISEHPTQKTAYSLAILNVRSLAIVRNDVNTVIPKNDDDMFIYNYQSDGVLWSGMINRFRYLIEPISGPKPIPFFLSLTYWSEDAKLKHLIKVVDPETLEFLMDEDESVMNAQEREDYIARAYDFVNRNGE